MHLKFANTYTSKTLNRLWIALVLLTVVIALAACDSETTDSTIEVDDNDVQDASTSVLAIGDSILEWNAEEAQSIPDMVGRETGLSVINAAVGGSTLQGGEGIPTQYRSEDWAWVIIDGGGNDVGDADCSCQACQGLVDSLIDPDAQAGTMVSLVEQISGDGAQILLLGYYQTPEGSEFYGCKTDLILALNGRYALLAEARDNVHYLDMGEVVTPDLYEEYITDDLVHPTSAGSKAIGERIAQLILEN